MHIWTILKLVQTYIYMYIEIYTCMMFKWAYEVGTDVLGMKTTARREGSEWVLNGAKMWITNGTVDGNGTGDAYLAWALKVLQS